MRGRATIPPRRVACPPGAMFAALLIAAVVAAACGSNQPSGATAPPVPGSGQPSSGSSPVAGPAEDAAEQAEVEVARTLREATGLSKVLGPAAPALIDALEKSEAEFARKAYDEAIAKLGLQGSTGRSNAIASTGGTGTTGPALDDGTGSFGGASTGFLASFFLEMAPQLIDRATSKDFQQDTLSKHEPGDFESGGIKEHVDLTETIRLGLGRGRVVMDVTLVSDSTMTNAETGAVVARNVSTAKAHFDVNACPEADGTTKDGRYTLTRQSETSAPGAANSGGVSSTDGPFKIFDGDDARLIRTDFTAGLAAGAHGERAPAGGGAAALYDWGATATYPISIPASGSATVDRSGQIQSHGTSPGDTDVFEIMLIMADSYLSKVGKAAESFWRGGNCIDLKTTEKTRDVSPDEQVGIDINPVHKFDGQPVKAPVIAKFNGTKEVRPVESPVDPPSHFDFTSGPNEGDKGTIDFQQTGKRGIGKLEIVYTVKKKKLLATITGHVVLDASLNHDVLDLEVKEMPLTATGNGSYEGSTEVHWYASISYPDCKTAHYDDTFTGTVTVRVDERDPTTIYFKSLATLPPLKTAQITCHGVTYPFSAGSLLAIWFVPAEQRMTLGTTATIDRSQSIIRSILKVLVVEKKK